MNALPLHVRVRIERRDGDLQRLGYRNYSHYLSSPHWLDLRRRYSESGLPQVCMCGAGEIELHHTTYERLGAEQLTDLMPLCSTCHHIVHVLERRGEMGLDFSGFEDPVRAMRYRLERASIRERAEREAPQDRTEAAMERRKQWRRARRLRQRRTRLTK